MKLAVGMIVKNESKVIERCLNSIKDIVDILIISDTGSTDNTIEIIKNFCTKNKIKFEIYRNEWKNFGTNRTELLRISKNKSDYLLLLDADMVVELNNFQKENLNSDFYHIRYCGDLDYSQILLIKNNLDWDYVGVTHEYIQSVEAKKVGEIESIKITHLYDGQNRKDKFQRDIILLEQGIKDEPNNARYYFYLANSYRDIGDYKKAIELYQKRISLGGWEEEIFYSYYQTGFCQELLGNFYDAKDAYWEAFEFRPTRAEPLYKLSVLCRNLKEYQQAYIYAKKGLEISYPKDLLFIEKPIYNYLLLFEKSISSYYINKFQESYDDCKKLLNDNKVSQSIRQQTRVNITFSEQKLFGKIITSHFDKEAAFINLKEIYEVCNDLKIKIFPCAGTLLGIIREGDFIAHDTDMDFSIKLKDYSSKLIPALVSKGFSFSCSFGKLERGYELRFFKRNVQVDIFVFYEGNNYEYICCYDNNGNLYEVKFDKFELRDFVFKGMKIFIPNLVEKYLMEQYGENWKVPNKNWSYLTSPKNIFRG